MAEPVALKYRAFISYSHRDKKWCEWLHRSLEGFRIGKDLVGRPTPVGKVPPTLRPIFRDREDFSAGHSLSEQSIAALEASQFLIVLCSPNAARSQYVNEEIRYFKSLGRADRVLPLIIAGEPGDLVEECFPAAMRFNVGADGALTDEREEPIAADAKPQGDGKTIALSKLVAGLLGIGFDEIMRRAERARKRRNRIWAAIAGVIIFLSVSASGSAVYAYNKLIESEENLDHAVTFAYGFVSEAAAQADRYGVSIETTLRLLRRAESALEGLMAAGHSTPTLRYRRAVMLLSFADNYFKLGQTVEALGRANEARAQLSELTEPPIAARQPWRLDLARAHIQIGNVKVEQGILNEAVASYRQALAILEQLTASDPGRRDWQLALARAHERIGNGLSDQGASVDAQGQYRKALDIAGRVVRADPENADASALLAIAYQRVGNILSQQGSLKTAIESYRAGLAIRQRLVAADPDNTRLQRDLMALHNDIGDTLKTQGSLGEALAAYQGALGIAERLAKSDPRNTVWQRELTVSYLRIGDVHLAQRQLDNALASYQAGLAVAERLATVDPRNVNWQRDLAIWYDRIGRVQEEQEQRAAALASYRRSLEITVKVAASDPHNAVWQHDLSLAHSRLGDLLYGARRFPDALASYRNALSLTERLSAADPADTSLQRDLAVLHSRIASVHRDEEHIPESLASERIALAILQRLAGADPTNTQLQRDLVVSHNNIGTLLVGLKSPEEAVRSYIMAVAISERLAAADPENVQWQLDLASSNLRLALMGNDQIKRLRQAVEILRKLKDAGKLTTQQEVLLKTVKSMIAPDKHL